MLLEVLLKTLLAGLQYVFIIFGSIPADPFLQYILPPGSVAYSGCVGDDVLAEQLRAANKREGLDDYYLVKKGGKTGACAVVITGHNRYVALFNMVLTDVC